MRSATAAMIARSVVAAGNGATKFGLMSTFAPAEKRPSKPPSASTSSASTPVASPSGSTRRLKTVTGGVADPRRRVHVAPAPAHSPCSLNQRTVSTQPSCRSTAGS